MEVEKLENIKLYNGDCLEVMKDIPDGSVDLILTDPPYGTVTDIGNAENVKHGMKGKTSWDNVLDYELMWEQINRVLRKNGKCVLFSQEPFTSDLIKSATPNVPFNYRSIWVKDHFANSLIAKKAPVNYYEDICVFNKISSCDNNTVKVYLKKEKDKAYSSGWTDRKLRELCSLSLKGGGLLCHYWGSGQWMMPTEEKYKKLQETGFFKKPYIELQEEYKKYSAVFNLWQGGKYKSNIFNYKKDYDGFHPTQKPVALLEDLIKTYSNENDLILDFTMGSGSTGVACKNTNRKFIGIEIDKEYYEVAKQRLINHQKQLTIF